MEEPKSPPNRGSWAEIIRRAKTYQIIYAHPKNTDAQRACKFRDDREFGTEITVAPNLLEDFLKSITDLPTCYKTGGCGATFEIGSIEKQ